MEEFTKLDVMKIVGTGDNNTSIKAFVVFRGGVALKVEGNINTHLVVDMQFEPGSTEKIQEIVTTVSAVMGEGPILRAKYPFPEDLKEQINFIGALANMPHLSMRANILACEYWYWNTYNPEQALKRKFNDVCDPHYKYYLQAELYGGRKQEDYIDDTLMRCYQQAKKLHETFEGIYGLDPGTADYAKLEGAKGLKLYLSFLFALNEQKIRDDKWAKLTLDYVTYRICQTEHIAVSEPSSEHRLRPNLELLRQWYLFYSDHCNLIGDEKLSQAIDAYHREEDLTPYEPKTDWH